MKEDEESGDIYVEPIDKEKISSYSFNVRVTARGGAYIED